MMELILTSPFLCFILIFYFGLFIYCADHLATYYYRRWRARRRKPIAVSKANSKTINDNFKTLCDKTVDQDFEALCKKSLRADVDAGYERVKHQMIGDSSRGIGPIEAIGKEYEIRKSHRVDPELTAVVKSFDDPIRPIWTGDALQRHDQPNWNVSNSKRWLPCPGDFVGLHEPTPETFYQGPPAAIEPVLDDNDDEMIDYPTPERLAYCPVVGYVLPKFGGYYVESLGQIRVENGKDGQPVLIVTLDNYYDIEQIKNAFGQIEFIAIDFLPPPESSVGFEAGGAVKKFQILNWVLTNVPAQRKD